MNKHPPSKMSVYEQAIAENNRAVALIDGGNYEAAISSLSITLGSFKHVVAHYGDAAATRVLNTSLNECMANSSSSPVLDGGISAKPAGSFLYDKAISIPGAQIGTSYHECTMVSCIIIFNLALAHHLHFRWSNPTNPTRNISLSKALKLYELTFEVQRRAVLENSDMFRLAAINNIGVLYRQRHDEEAATKCFEFVLSMLVHIADCGHSGTFVLDGFFRNVSNLISQHNAAPAAS
jgi:hypothetical protein